MLFKNDIFIDEEIRYRLLHVDVVANSAWVINMDDQRAWPVQATWDKLASLSAIFSAGDVSEKRNEAGKPGSSLTALKVTSAMLHARDKALEILGDLPTRTPEIFDPAQRGYLVCLQEQKGYARSAIYKNLRRWWVGGQTSAALFGDFHRCGRGEVRGTAGRGARPTGEQGTFQIKQIDYNAFTDIVENLYLKDNRLKISRAYQRLLEKHYQTADGNGKLWVLPQGERPSLRQFEYFLRQNYPLEHRLRKREGDKDFERDHRPVLGTVLERCLGVGHQYEADATIADVYLVARDDRRRIVGKPCIYLIIDRKSRLIVGWYIGFENSSWVCAMQALLTISMDKQAICERYGVEYDPTDWPAHQVFPSELIADRELLQKASDQIADDLETTVVNLASQRPDHKPIVETQFKLLRMRLQDGIPAMDPPENAKRRMGRHYEKDACLTLDEFTAIILLAIIAHNRSPLNAYDLSLSELTDGVLPLPLEIWNYGIPARSGALTRYPEERVRLALLPRGEATVSENGILFKGCYYTCPEAIERGWFVAARKRRFKVMVSYDSRLVDRVYVHATDKPGQRGQVYTGVLTTRSQKHEGLSFAEVRAYECFHNIVKPSIKQVQIQSLTDYHTKTTPIIDDAEKQLKAAGPKATRTARRKDTKADRQKELQIERQEAASLPALTKASGSGASSGGPAATAQVVSLLRASATAGVDDPTPAPPLSAALSLANKVRAMREKMRNG